MTISEQQKEKARKFSAMHRQSGMFILPNAWDVGSAYVFEKQGFAAVATSSAGIAYALGCPDSEKVSFDDYLWIVERMSRRLNVPLSVDFERGYGETADEVKDNARKMLLAGAVGFNIEDGQSADRCFPYTAFCAVRQFFAAFRRHNSFRRSQN